MGGEMQAILSEGETPIIVLFRLTQNSSGRRHEQEPFFPAVGFPYPVPYAHVCLLSDFFHFHFRNLRGLVDPQRKGILVCGVNIAGSLCHQKHGYRKF
ncbi:hypothetical protein NPIL_265421 [Nephila pilipes]|uniref:Uncharacterized protein n=1 Tax=Nephila pilipes TaxID=299642 RepID=A0A8X6PRZ5_NEPPI|nr:hypothetical protein NPIL_265421 [Nephila pilipes]